MQRVLEEVAHNITQLSNTTNTTENKGSGEAVVEQPQWYIYIICAFLSIGSALFAGLNLGVMTLDTKFLELLCMEPFETEEDQKTAKYAKKLLPIRRRGNLILCTILLGNVSVNALFSILLNEDSGGVVGFVASTVVILIFGEIVPQSLFKKYGLRLSAALTWFLYICMGLMFIIAFPISAILDKALGEEAGNMMSKTQMKRMFEMYEKEKLLTPSERKMLSAALEMQDTDARKVMTPLDKVYMLDMKSKLDKEQLKEIYESGYSRIPVYDKNKQNIIGMLLSRDLILIKPEVKCLTIRQLQSLMVRDIAVFDANTKLGPILNYFQKGKTHMGIVTDVQEAKEGEAKDNVIQVVGLITLEDIIGELLKNKNKEVIKEYSQQKEKKQLKERMLMLLNEKKNGKVLEEAEIFSICQYLQRQVKIFEQGKINKSVLIELIKHSEVIELKGDPNPKSLLAYKNKNDQKSVVTNNLLTLQQDKETDNNPYLKQFNNKYGDTQIGPSQQTLVGSPRSRKSNMKSVHTLILGRESLSQQKNSNKKQIEEEKLEDAQKQEIVSVEDLELDVKELKKGEIIKNGEQKQDFISLKISVKDVTEGEVNKEEVQKNQLYTCGQPSDEFYLILSGKVLVCSGQEGFFVELSTFNYLGVDALIYDTYSPDFSAKAISQTRLLRFKRIDYRKALYNPKNL